MISKKRKKIGLGKKFIDTPIFQDVKNLWLSYKDDGSRQYSISEITRILKQKYKKLNTLNVSTVKRWIDKYKLNKDDQNIRELAIEKAITESQNADKKDDLLIEAKVNDLKEKYKNLDTIFKQSSFLCNRIMQIKIKELEEFIKTEPSYDALSEFLNGLDLSEKDLSFVNKNAFECLQKLNPENENKNNNIEPFIWHINGKISEKNKE
ncbi:MAG TPA: hypothetical protein PK771_08390 [Spirochaetota bacterium]|nr:hypothetical protein [Spirochaetota bacterium]